MTSSSGQGGEGRRRFQRIQAHYEDPNLAKILGVQVVWENQESTAVFDLSYQGAAVIKPSLELALASHCSICLRLGDKTTSQVQSEIRWLGEKSLGIFFTGVTSQDRLMINHFLNDKLIGANLKLISPSLYDKKNDFRYWFHGPKDTNIYLWVGKSQQREALLRAEIEWEGLVFSFKNGTWGLGGGSSGAGIQSVYDENREEAADTGPVSLFSAKTRLIDILSQIPYPPPVVVQLIQELTKL